MQTLRLAQQAPADALVRVELVDTPFYPQQRYQCGPAALATVLTNLGIETTPEALKPLVYLPERRGSLQIEMLAAARQFGVLPVRLAPRLEAIIQELATGNPVLVLQNLAFSWAPRWHFAVVVGYDLEKQIFVLRSGTTQRWLTSFSTFERTWRRGEYWAVSIVPSDRVPASADALSYLTAVHTLEEIGRVQDAQRGYQAASRRWPGNLLALMGLGNTAYAQGDYQAAQRAFLEALATHPTEAAAWNNLAYVLHAQGCRDEALWALRCATKLAPNDPRFSDSRQEFEQASPSTDTGCKAPPLSHLVGQC